MGAKPDLNAVRALVADAEPVATVRIFDGDPNPGQPLGNIKPGQWQPDILGLPPGCPVVPLGVDGTVSYFLDPIGQLYSYQKPYGQGDTLELFRGRHKWLYWAFPKFGRPRPDKDGNEVSPVDAWRNEKARECLIAAATAKGPWNAVDKVRGRGAWSYSGGGLVLHCGETLFKEQHLANSKLREPPGALDGFVYPTRPPVPRPWPLTPDESANPAKILRQILNTWNWARPNIDPHLMLGWIGVGYLGGALSWRSNIYVTGDKGCGKSTLQDLLKGVFGDWLLTSTNTTAAGIYQHVKQDCLPVWVDEFESKADNSRAKALLELARQASSGGRGLRGGDRGTGSEFTISSAFAFSSINAPPMEPQDLSRFALLQLRRLPPGAESPDLDPQQLGVLGRCVLRQLMLQWPRFGYTLKAFRAELARAGMDSRGQDTFGTLLACADLIEYDGWDEDRLRTAVDGDLKPWAELMAITGMIEFEDASENWKVCLNHLLSVPVEAWRNGTKSTVGQVVEAWHSGKEYDNDIVKVRNILSQAGLGLQRLTRADDWLVIPNNNPLTRKLFEGSKFVGEQGAGVWAGALRQGPENTLQKPGQCKVNGVKSRCTLVSLAALYGPDGIMTDDEPPGSPPAVNTTDPDPNVT